MERRHDAEIMDDFSIQDERIDDALRELKMINTFLGGKRTTQKGFSILRKNKSLAGELSVLDVGAGGADVFENDNDLYVITAIDKNPRACSYLKNHTHYTVVCGDAMELPFSDKSFDVVHVSLFLHHFTEEKIIQLMRSFSRVARHGIIINDLQRSRLALIGITILTLLFSRSRMVKHDGPLSVQRSFTKFELVQILNSLKYSNVYIQWRWAFRWLVVITL